jgi:8-oxo-dGTP pyrophosphatase MutT (NUDIX family)
MAVRLRQGVRAVIVDDASSILLVCFDLPQGPLWAAPGGGIEAGETAEAAIRRELIEEVGIYDADVGPIIWTRTHVFPLSPDFDGQQEVFFLVRSNRALGRPSMTPDELRAEGLAGSRWWTSDQLRSASGDRFAPQRLSANLDALLADGPPASPIDVGV